MDRRARGKHYELLAKNHLIKEGLTLVTENYRSRWGEIDLILNDANVLVFVEVRFRGIGSYTSGVASVDTRKQQKLCRTALFYLSTKTRGNPSARFDVVSISEKNASEITIDWVKNAFECA